MTDQNPSSFFSVCLMSWHQIAIGKKWRIIQSATWAWDHIGYLTYETLWVALWYGKHISFIWIQIYHRNLQNISLFLYNVFNMET